MWYQHLRFLAHEMGFEGYKDAIDSFERRLFGWKSDRGDDRELLLSLCTPHAGAVTS